MNIKIINFFKENKGILEQINKDKNIKKSCENCEFKRKERFILQQRCSILDIKVESQWICDKHKFSDEFKKYYAREMKSKEANLIKRKYDKPIVCKK